MKKQLLDHLRPYIKREREILLKNDTENHLVKLRSAFQDRTKLYLVTDYYCGGSLKDFWDTYPMTAEQINHCICNISKAIQNLHGRDIVHRDIKLENFLIDRHGDIYLTDFGYSKTGVTQPDRGARTTWGGTNGYKAPEIVQEKPYGKAVDWWSFGVVVYELFTGALTNCVPGTKNRIDIEWDIRLREILQTIPPKKTDEEKLTQFMNEALNLPKLSHPNKTVLTGPLNKKFPDSNTYVNSEGYPTVEGIIEWYRLLIQADSRNKCVIENFQNLGIHSSGDTIKDGWEEPLRKKIQTIYTDDTLTPFITDKLRSTSRMIKNASYWTNPLMIKYSSGPDAVLKRFLTYDKSLPTLEGIIEWYRIALTDPRKIDTVVHHFQILDIVHVDTNSWVTNILTRLSNVSHVGARTWLEQLLDTCPNKRWKFVVNQWLDGDNNPRPLKDAKTTPLSVRMSDFFTDDTGIPDSCWNDDDEWSTWSSIE